MNLLKIRKIIFIRAYQVSLRLIRKLTIHVYCDTVNEREILVRHLAKVKEKHLDPEARSDHVKNQFDRTQSNIFSEYDTFQVSSS